MSATSAITRRYRIAKNLHIDITVGKDGFVTEWDPAMPERFSSKMIHRYRQARNEMCQRLVDHLGEPMVMVEYDDNGKLQPMAFKPREVGE